MGMALQYQSYVPGYHSIMDMNEDSNSSSWSLFYGDKALSNGQYYNGYMPRTAMDGYPGSEKDMLKQKMLEHEAIFKNQVYELHRLYRVQRDMMEDIKRKELYNHRVSTEASSSSSRLPSQIPLDETRNWHIPSFPLANSSCARQSILGSDVTDSPLSCTKGNSIQTGRVPSQNKYNLKDYGLSESRPSKIRKKLFDLQLPADEYIDTEEGEQIQDTKISEVSSYHINGDHRVAHENIAKSSLGGKKTEILRCNSSVSCLRSSNVLADLNEPIQVKEAAVPKSVDFLGRSACGGELRSLNSYAKPKPQFIDLSEEYSQTSHHASTSENLNNLSAANKVNRKGWLSYMYEAGNSERDSNHIPHRSAEQLPISYHQTEFMVDKAHQPPRALRTDFRREEFWSERNRSYDISDRSRDRSSYNHKDSVAPPHISNPCSLVNSPDMNSWSHSVASWGKPNSTLTQKLTSVHARPSLVSSETLNRSFHSSVQSQVISGDKWHTNGNRGLNPALESDLHIRNGFYHGSSSTFKEPSVDLSSVGYDRANHNKHEVIVSKRLINHDSRNVFKGPDMMDLNSRKDLNLNVTFPRNSFNEAVPLESLEIINGKRKHEEKPSALPWLMQKPLGKDAVSVTRKDQNLGQLDFFQASSNKWVKNETIKDSNNFYAQNIPSVLSGHNVGTRREAGDCPSNGKILGIPIFGKLCMSKNDSSSLVSTSESVHLPSKRDDKRPEEKHRGFDMNVACSLMDDEFDEPVAAGALVVQNGLNTKVNNFRNFDLNSCISEDEDQFGSSVASTNAKGKIVFEIDLEAPVVLDTEEAMSPRIEQNQHESPLQPHHPKEQDDEVVKIAAEAIVAISKDDQDDHLQSTHFNTSDASLSHSLLWLAEAISSSAEDSKHKICKGFGARIGGDIEELDYFEAMTLQLKETREEDYMPKPFVPEIQGTEEAGGSLLPSRTRKGQARRGRQRRDFQRDILPGLVSLSRHEVTEDIQTFGSLMRATGHQWNGGLTRRNGTRSGAARGRRRCVVDPAPAIAVTPVAARLMLQPSSIEVGLEDRSLTGWGKTTRRPRRQRCPAGNNLAVAFT